MNTTPLLTSSMLLLLAALAACGGGDPEPEPSCLGPAISITATDATDTGHVSALADKRAPESPGVARVAESPCVTRGL